MEEWYFAKSGNQLGPVSVEEIENQFRNGELNRSTLVWRDGMSEWKPIEIAIPQLNSASSEPNVENGVTCAISGAVRPAEEMLEYGEHFVLPQHKEELVQRLHEGLTVGAQATTGLEDPRGRAKGAKVTIIGVTIFELMNILVSFFGSDYAAEELNQADYLAGVLAMLFLPLYIITIVLFCRWKMLAMRNAHRLSTEPLEFTPGWAVGWYFVPIFMLWKPYQAMRELWDVSFGVSSGVGGSTLVSAWWGAWILGGVLNQISFRAAMNGLRQLEMGVNIALIPFSILLAVFAVKLIHAITAEQVSKLPYSDIGQSSQSQ